MPNDKAMDPAVLEFIAEGKEIIERVSQCLQEIERASGIGTPDQVGALYRDMHTLKGSAQLFGYQAIGLIGHAMEASLDPLRKSKAAIPNRLLDSCLKNLDLLDRLLKNIEANGNEGSDHLEVTRLASLLVDAATDNAGAEFKLTKDQLYTDEKRTEIKTPAPKSPEVIESSVKKKTPAAKPLTQEAVAPVEAIKPEVQVPMNSNPPTPVETTTASAQQPVAGQIESTVRVQVSLLDRILNLVGELVLVRNQLLQHRNKTEDPEFLATSKSLDVVTSELQGEVMKTRMQPIDTVVGKFQRLVRDISKDLAKRIDLTLEGADTELDKSLLEAIKDPLTHIVRNSCDHGIEGPEERKKANKPETGHLLIRSFHEGGQVVIEISDDGRGLNRQKITAKAIEKGLITQEKAAKMSDREICEIIFLPGFSTAQQVTSVSGRGVGMDVVRTNIEKIGGSVIISSVYGKGTTLQLRIPLTLAIVPALLIKSGKEKFAIPQVKLVELVRVGGDSNSGKIEFLQGRPMYRLRGALLPLYDLGNLTGEKTIDYSQGSNIVVLNVDGDYFGLLISEILDTADIVVKPMVSFLRHLNVFSGSTILGDGTVALILDVGGVAEYGKVLGKKKQGDERELFSRGEKAAHAIDIQEFLFFSIGQDATHAVPLCLVQRLEEFEPSVIEHSGEQKVARYRGALLPLIDLRAALNYKKAAAVTNAENLKNDRISVVVIQRSGRNYGIVVDEILDVVTVDAAIDDTIRDRTGILGNLLYQDSVIVVVDALGIIERITPDLAKGNGKKAGQAALASESSLDEIRSRNRDLKLRKIRVLYAEDVAFFRRHVSKVLNEAGMDVTTVEDGMKAVDELRSASDGQYNLILSDIEMPRMNGLELAAEIRKMEKYRNTPLIALTTRFREKDISDGKAAGFDIYLEKLNPEKLLASIQSLMSEKSNAKESEKEVNS